MQVLSISDVHWPLNGEQISCQCHVHCITFDYMCSLQIQPTLYVNRLGKDDYISMQLYELSI